MVVRGCHTGSESRTTNIYCIDILIMMMQPHCYAMLWPNLFAGNMNFDKQNWLAHAYRTTYCITNLIAYHDSSMSAFEERAS